MSQQDTTETVEQLDEQELQTITGGMCDQCGDIVRQARNAKVSLDSKIDSNYYRLGLNRAKTKSENLGDLIDSASASIGKKAKGRLGVCEDYAKHSDEFVKLSK